MKKNTLKKILRMTLKMVLWSTVGVSLAFVGFAVTLMFSLLDGLNDGFRR